MLDQAQQRATEYGWKNRELVQSDAAQYKFPNQVDGIISTFAFTFIPECASVVQNGCKALAPGRTCVVMDMAWPDGLRFWWQHFLFFLPYWGITTDVIQRHPWQLVHQAMKQYLVNVEYEFWMGFFYLASGRQTC